MARFGANQRKSRVAASAPQNCATRKPGTFAGLIPENVSLRERAIVTAGFAKDVEDVNQYADVMYAPTANGAISERNREQPQITHIKPNVATNSLKTCAPPLRACCDRETAGNPNIKWAVIAPVIPPTHCTAMYPA